MKPEILRPHSHWGQATYVPQKQHVLDWFTMPLTPTIFFTSVTLGLQDMDIPFDCLDSVPDPVNLNYPSIQIHRLIGTKTVTRRVTNVGHCHSNYTFSATAHKEYTITASPDVLVFDHSGQELSFNITVTAVSWNLPSKYDPDFYYFGSYSWTHGHHVVRRPVAVSFP